MHTELEAALAAWKGTDAAVCFPTGFAANLGALSVLGGPAVRVLSDELNHASIIDGVRLSRSPVSIYRHCDVAHLAALLEADPTTPTIVVTDTVFSMDGDAAPVEEIAALCRRHGALLLLDEAHAVLGPHLPASLTADPELTLVRMGTLSKTLGSLGGFLAGSRDVIDLMVNAARPYIFTTGLSPADAAAALAALGVLRSPEGRRRWSGAWPTWWRGSAASDRRRPGHAGTSPRARSSRSSWAPSSGPSRPRRPCWPRACGCRPSARRPCRPARADCASPSPPRTPTTRCAGWSMPWRPCGPPCSPGLAERCVRGAWSWWPGPGPTSARHGSPPGSSPPSAPRAPRWPPASRPSPSIPPTIPPGSTPPSSARPAARPPRRSAARAGGTRSPWRRPWRPTRSDAAGSPWPNWCRSWPGRRRPSTSAWWRRRAGCARRRPTTATSWPWRRLLAPDIVLLVADAGLGTLNSVRLSVDALPGSAPVVVVLNRYDQGNDLHVRNRRWLTEEDGLTVVTMPGGEEALATRVHGN